jgi:uncharacterized membrane protein
MPLDEHLLRNKQIPASAKAVSGGFLYATNQRGIRYQKGMLNKKVLLLIVLGIFFIVMGVILYQLNSMAASLTFLAALVIILSIILILIGFIGSFRTKSERHTLHIETQIHNA